MPRQRKGASADGAGPATVTGGVIKLSEVVGKSSGLRGHRRRALVKKEKELKKKEKRARRTERKRLKEELGDKAPPPSQPQRTLENTREWDDTVVDPEDDEVAADQETDELADYFDGRPPKVVVTTSDYAVGPDTFKFAKVMAEIVPGAEFIPRKGTDLKKIVAGAISRGYTDVLVVNEDRKKPTALLHSHLPAGPTAHFKLTSVKFPKEIRNHGRKTSHHPEIILNNFHTRLGHQVGRLMNALFPQSPEFQGRSVVTFHNQRDFIFFRYHRYIFKNAKKVGLQELGPRFTLKLRSLQKGTFDTKFGEYEWVHKRKEMDTSRRKFFL